ncbi:hypothetical protein Sjap_011265 [Stephania japonica]|uniref:Uncharacterized protein n=1 Tax=Stephania japonica TaxID=461633 RepID=A0AAP0P4X0_9MAGN
MLLDEKGRGKNPKRVAAPSGTADEGSDSPTVAAAEARDAPKQDKGKEGCSRATPLWLNSASSGRPGLTRSIIECGRPGQGESSRLKTFAV